MKRHELWDKRAQRLMERTIESWTKDKKKKVYQEEGVCPKCGKSPCECKQMQENSLLDMDDYNMLKKAVTGPVDKLLADGYTKEDLVDAFKACLDMDQSEIDAGGVSQEVYTMVDELKMHVGKVDMDEDAREYISDELLMILDKMDKSSMNEEEAIADPEVERAEDTARKAQIKALKAKLKAMQKTQGM